MSEESAPATVTPFRDLMLRVTPKWLQGYRVLRLMYSFGVMMDLLYEWAVDAIRRRFPGADSADSMSLIGRDRKISRGHVETAATYAARTLKWLDDHATRGGPYAMLSQLGAFWAGPDSFRIDLVYRNGRHFKMEGWSDPLTPQPIIRDLIEWEPDPIPVPEQWARWWLIYYWPTDLTIPTWGSGDWGSGVWGTSLTQVEAEEIRLIPSQWNNAHCFGNIILLPNGAHIWGEPELTWGAPGLTWGSGSTVTRLSVD